MGEKIFKIVNADCLTAMRKIRDNRIDCVVTSPPYWGLRSYNTEPQIWGSSECEHVKGETNPGKEAWYKEQDGINENSGSFCSLCGAWKGELGLEPNFQLYIQHLMQIFIEVKRILKPEGTCWVNIASSYCNKDIFVVEEEWY